jgi:hypothetical protein
MDTHRRKLFNGKTTAEEFHRKHAFRPGERCTGCGGPPAITVRVFLPLDEIVKRQGEAIGRLLITKPDAFVGLCIETIHGVYVRASQVHACTVCAPALERQAAKAPSWALVEINRGPGPDKPLISVSA